MKSSDVQKILRKHANNDKALFLQINKLYYFKLTKEVIFEMLDKLN